MQARQFILQMYLIDHALDCPTCDKSGECYLQDNTYLHNINANPYRRPKFAQPYDPLQRDHRLQVGPLHHVQPLHARLRRDDRRHRHRVASPQPRGDDHARPTAIDLSETTLHQLRHVHRGLPGRRADRPPFRPSPVGARHDRDDLRLLRRRLHAQRRIQPGHRPPRRRISGSAASTTATSARRGKWGHEQVQQPDRIFYPRVRERRRHRTTKSTWDDAIDSVAETLAHYQGDQFAALDLAGQHQRRGLRAAAVHPRGHGQRTTSTAS